MRTVTVKTEPEDKMPSTSASAVAQQQQQHHQQVQSVSGVNSGLVGGGGTVVSVSGPSTTSQTIQLSVEPNNQHATIVEATDQSGQQHIVTQHENTDGTTSLSIAQVQNLQSHQLTIGNLNQVKIGGV